MPPRSAIRNSEAPSDDHCGLMSLLSPTAGNGCDRAGRQIDERHTIGPDRERAQVRREAIGRKRDAPAVRRPRGLNVGIRIARERPQLLRFQIVDVQVREPAAHPREAERRSVRRPGGIENLVQRWEWNLPLLVAAGGVVDGQRGTALGDRRDGDPLAGGVPPAGGMDELDARRVRIARRAGQLVPDPAGRRIGHEQVDRQKTPLGQKSDPFAVRAERRAEVDAAPRVSAGDEPSNLISRSGGRQDRLVGLGGSPHATPSRAPSARRRGSSQ